mmetsp:Transcript_53535/g.99017  ORF Transcript_53535/g.99017 Transcript_53535/m.99017 type:complete len:92 (-) Transcript_53535:374-649(-)
MDCKAASMSECERDSHDAERTSAREPTSSIKSSKLLPFQHLGDAPHSSSVQVTSPPSTGATSARGDDGEVHLGDVLIERPLGCGDLLAVKI